MPDPAPVSVFDRIGAIKPISRDSTVEDIGATLATLGAALVEVRGDQQRYHERLERVLPTASAALQRAKQNEGAVWEPGGTDAHLYARYLEPDGRVRLRTSTVEIPLPDGSVYRQSRPGLLDDPYPPTRSAQLVSRAYLSLALAYRRARHLSPSAPWGDLMLRKAYSQLRQRSIELPGEVGRFFRRYFDEPDFRRAVSNTSGSGGELIEVPTIASVRLSLDLARRIPGLFRQENAIASSFKQPIVTGRALPRKRGKTSTNSPAQYAVATFTTSDVTISVIDRVIMALLDPLWVADQGQVLGDPVGFVSDWLMRGDMDGVEWAILHGDTAGTHQDTIASWTLGSLYAAGDFDGADSPMKFYLGLRARAFDDSATVAGGGTFDMTDHAGALDLMGVHAAGAVAIWGLHGYFTQLVGNTLFTTVDKMGDRATQLTGEVGSLGGKPVVISEGITNDLASTGLYTGSGTTTCAVYVDPDAWTLSDHQSGADDFEQIYADKGAHYIGMVRRQAFYPNCISTEKPVSVVINL